MTSSSVLLLIKNTKKNSTNLVVIGVKYGRWTHRAQASISSLLSRCTVLLPSSLEFAWLLFSSHKILQNFLYFLSHQILRHMYGTLNIN